MDQANVKNSSYRKKSLEENVGKHTNSDSVENLEKLTIRTKNGLVNGVADDKCKANKKHAKININTNVTKESKRNKKAHSSNVQMNDVDVSNSHTQKRNKGGQKCNKIESSNQQNCITEIDSNEKCDLETSQSPAINNANSRDFSNEISQSKSSQSETKLTETSSKSETKRKKNKSKLNRNEQNSQVNEGNFNLPNFELASTINSTISNESLPKMSDAGTTSQLATCNSHLLECQNDSSEFEKNLIESIKNLKIQQDTAKSNTDNSENLEESKQSNEITADVHTEENLFDVTYVQYESELQMPMIMRIIQKDLSEPYSIYTYRYFIHNWPKLCFLAMCDNKCVGAIVCKLDFHRKSTKRGYIAMLAVDKDYRKRRIGSTLVRRAIKQMIAGGADEVVLETEVTNKPALRLYEQLGFVRDKRLFRYYLNGVDALRLKLWLR